MIRGCTISKTGGHSFYVMSNLFGIEKVRLF